MPFTIRENIPLRDLTTFRIGGPARFFCEVYTEGDLIEAVSFAQKKCAGRFFVLGGGSNVLVSDAGFGGLVICMKIKGIIFSDENSWKNGITTVGAGEEWDSFVKKTIEDGYGGLENLSLIPGTVGAAPVQNIGAYGTEVAAAIFSVRAYDTETGTWKLFKKDECEFKYRDSFFKKTKNSSGQARYIITEVSFTLSKGAKPNISYKDIHDYFEKKGTTEPSLVQVREAVISIRKVKLPDIAVVGTAGSFFKNPIIKVEDFEALKKRYPDLPGFSEKTNPGFIKVPLAWIIDTICGYRGISQGNVGTYKNQALVLVNNGNATFL
jgi:UDP-N-acetylmuramate dehydrogenase